MLPSKESTRRAGFTLIEVLISLALMLLIFGSAVPFFKVQTRSMMANSGRLDALQNARFALNAIDREIRVAGLGVVQKQPMIVQVDPYAVTFNANLVSEDMNDPEAVYHNPDAPPSATQAFPPSRRTALPLSAALYPDSNYMSGGIPSGAETISYWLSADRAATRPRMFGLWRRVNYAESTLVTKGIYIAVGVPVFQYYLPDATTGQPLLVPQAGMPALPWIHKAAIHGAANDTGQSRLTDSLRSVRVTLTALYTDPDKGDVMKTVSSTIRLINAGMNDHDTCGDLPIAVPIVAAFAPATGVTLSWAKSIDQTAGEKDVERYALYRRPTGAALWGEPFASVPATANSYTLVDKNFSSGSWDYGLIAQDCSFQNSALTTTVVVIP